MAPAVTIVVLLTVAELAERCLRAIAAAGEPEPESELVLVVSGDDPALGAVVAELGADATVLKSSANSGTAASWNLAIEQAHGAHVAILHEDSEPQRGWLDAALATTREHPEAAVVGSRLVEPDGLVNGGWLIWDDGHTTLLSDRNAPAVLANQNPYPVDYVSGAAVLIERAVWEQVGGYDERFFPAVYADADICTAVWQLGRSVLSDPRSRVLHRTGAMVNEQRGALGSPEFRRFLIWRQRRRFVEKWEPALADHAGRPGDVLPSDVGTADVERAARRTRRSVPGAFVVAQRPLTADPEGLEARLLEAQVAIASEFADWLLAERHVETEAAREAHEAAARLWHERDELHVVLRDVIRERDEALARLARLGEG
jgi:GT2 family glycosyltransferase